jgi:hypothetical protein
MYVGTGRRACMHTLTQDFALRDLLSPEMIGRGPAKFCQPQHTRYHSNFWSLPVRKFSQFLLFGDMSPTCHFKNSESELEIKEINSHTNLVPSSGPFNNFIYVVRRAYGRLYSMLRNTSMTLGQWIASGPVYIPPMEKLNSTVHLSHPHFVLNDV